MLPVTRWSHGSLSRHFAWPLSHGRCRRAVVAGPFSRSRALADPSTRAVDRPRTGDDLTPPLPAGRQAAGRGRHGRRHDVDRAGTAKTLGRTPQGGTRGDHVVDHEHPPAGDIGPDAERRALEPIDTATTGLRWLSTIALEQPTAPQPELTSHLLGHQLRLVEPALAPTTRRGGRPGHHVDIDPGTDAGCQQPVHEQTCEMPGELAAIPVLEPQHDVARAAGERHRRDHTVIGGTGRPGQTTGGLDEREPTGSAQRDPGAIAPGTT